MYFELDNDAMESSKPRRRSLFISLIFILKSKVLYETFCYAIYMLKSNCMSDWTVFLPCV